MLGRRVRVGHDPRARLQVARRRRRAPSCAARCTRPSCRRAASSSTAPAYGPRRYPSSSEMICMARTLGAPGPCRPGSRRAARRTASRRRAARRRPPRRGARRGRSAPPPSSARRARCRRGRRARGRCGRGRRASRARRGPSPTRAAARRRPRSGSVVPAIGHRLARPSSQATSRSGDEPISARSSRSRRKRYGEGLTRRSAR